MKKKIVTVLFAAVVAAFSILGGCGATQETGGKVESTEINIPQQASTPASSVADSEQPMGAVDYKAMAEDMLRTGQLEEAYKLYIAAYEQDGDQQVLIDGLNMWLHELKDKEGVESWVKYITENCTDVNEELWTLMQECAGMSDELRSLVEKSNNGARWMIANITHSGKGDSYFDGECYVEYDESGRIIKSNMSLHNYYLSWNSDSDYLYEYLEDGRVKVTDMGKNGVEGTLRSRLETVQFMLQSMGLEPGTEDIYDYYDISGALRSGILEYYRKWEIIDQEQYDYYCNLDLDGYDCYDGEQLYEYYYENQVYDYYGLLPEDLEPIEFKILTFDDEGRLITEESWQDSWLGIRECKSVREFYYNLTYDINLGQGGLSTGKQAEIRDDTGKTHTQPIWYSGKKIGVFGISDLRPGGNDSAVSVENIYDKYGNLVRRSFTNNGNRYVYEFEYVFCTPEQYLEAKQTGDFSAYETSFYEPEVN